MFQWFRDLFGQPKIGKSIDNTTTRAVHKGQLLEISNAEEHFNQGLMLQRLDRHEEALASLDCAIRLKPDYIDALHERAIALRMLRRHGEAIACIDAILALKPDHTHAINNRGNALQDVGNFEEALTWYDHALRLKPDYADAWYNRGLALLELGRFEEALNNFECALKFKLDHVDALTHRGLALRYLNRLPDALACFKQALQIKPDHPEANFNEGSCRLLMGDLVLGWEKYEWRWKCQRFSSVNPSLNRPPWLGQEPACGKTLFLHAEQGLGDTIQFCRYAKLLAEGGATVLLAVQPALTSLLSGLDGVHMIYSMNEPLPAFDYHCPLLSLPLAFKTRLDTIPANIPYLYSDPDRVALWQARLGHTELPRIGLVWSGSAIHEDDHNRSIALSRFSKLLTRQARYVSLQKEIRVTDQAALNQHGDILYFGDVIEDFADTAALVELMDLVITVDTSVAHLAGAMGKPVWLLLPFTPDWRWLLDRTDSPWYPTVRLFRQPNKGDWDSVISTVIDELHQFVQRKA